jgi:fatty aldehyde-generating acyl-ACP reductase
LRNMGKFGFIIHPLSARTDTARRYPVARFLPERVIEWGLMRLSPRVISHITGVVGTGGREAEGWFGACTLTARQIASLDPDFVVRRIVETAELLAQAGAKVVGLGALTAVVPDSGVSVAKASPVPVTTGNTYTVATAVEGTLEAARLMGHEPAEATAAVVGATGSIGRVCAQMLSEKVGRMILVGRDEGRLKAVAEELPRESVVSADSGSSLPQADIVVTVTSAVDVVVGPEHLKPGAVVCDVARPRDVSPEVARKRKDVLVIEGGVVRVPDTVEFGFDFGFPPKTAYACMAETMILALEERYEPYTLGRDISLEKVREISALAEKHGFRLAGFRSFERTVTEEQIQTARELARARGARL